MSVGGTAPVLESAAELGPIVRSALRRQILTLADSKRLLGIRYSDWVLGSPSLETNIAMSSMAQDEWGHARLLYAMLKDFGEEPRGVEHGRPAAAYASLDVLDRPLEDWAALVAGMTVVDTALTVALEGFAGGSYEPARSRVPKMVSEEEFHRDLALAWFRRIADGRPDGRERLASAVGELLPRTLAWLLPDDEPFRELAGAGLVEPGAAATQRYQERLARSLAMVDMEIAVVAPAREGWDEERGRGPGHPSEEAVERARGDRNRALFVE